MAVMAGNDGFDAALNLQGDGAAKSRFGVGAHGIPVRVADHLVGMEALGVLNALLK